MSRFISVAIDEIRDETPEAYTLFFDNPDPDLFRYLPGQYLTLKVLINGEFYRRAFSLSSSPVLDHRLSVTIKRVQGGLVSNYLRDYLSTGDFIEIMPPMGHFTVTPLLEAANHYVLIGGGSGMTPLMSILRTVLVSEPNSKVSLWVCNKQRSAIIFREQLAVLSTNYPDRLHVFHTLTQPEADWTGARGRLDQKTIYQLVSELFMTDELRKQFYICGPSGLMDAAEKALEAHAVHPANIFRERYTAAVPSEAEVAAAYETSDDSIKAVDYFDGETHYILADRQIVVILDGKPNDILVRPNQTVLRAAMDAQLDPPYACQSGICTTCRAMLISGTVAMEETEGLSAAELEEGFVLTCQCHPLSETVELEYR